MEQHVFYSHIALRSICGLLLVLFMFIRGKYNSVEKPAQKHIFLRIIAGLLFLFSIVLLIMGIDIITRMEFPIEIDNRMSLDTPTSLQSYTLNLVTSFWACLALSAYFIRFKQSETTSWVKIKKMMLYSLIFALFYYPDTLHNSSFKYYHLALLFILFTFISLAITHDIDYVIENKDDMPNKS